MAEKARDMIEVFRKIGFSSASTVLHYAGKERCEPNQSFGPAQRAQYLLHFIISGRGIYRTHTGTYTITENHVFVIKPGDLTYYKADSEDPWCYIWFAFSSPDADIILQNCGLLQDMPYVSYQPDDCLYGYLEAIIELLRSQTYTDYDILANMFSVFAHLTRCYRSKNSIASSNPYIVKAVDFIVNSYSYPIGVSHIADYVGLERTYLYRLFKSELNTSPKQYLTSYRLRVARDLLTNTQLSIDMISQKCGFADNATFSKIFSQYNGLSPLKYRKMDGEQYLSWRPTHD